MRSTARSSGYGRRTPGSREFCDENARWYPPLTELRAQEPLLASLSEAVSQGMAYELGMDAESFSDT